MSEKRSPAVRCSSHGEIGLLTQAGPSYTLWEKKHPAVGYKPVSKPGREPLAKNSNLPPVLKPQQSPRKSILELGSPTMWETGHEVSKKTPNEGFGEFLKVCSLCKKKLKENDDVYMYGYLTAFCSADCRGDQIALDGFHKQVSSESSKVVTGRKDMRRPSGFKYLVD